MNELIKVSDLKNNEVDAYEYIIVETDEENPITIAIIEPNNIDCIKGYRVRLKPI